MSHGRGWGCAGRDDGMRGGGRGAEGRNEGAEEGLKGGGGMVSITMRATAALPLTTVEERCLVTTQPAKRHLTIPYLIIP